MTQAELQIDLGTGPEIEQVAILRQPEANRQEIGTQIGGP